MSPSTRPRIAAAVARIGSGPLYEPLLRVNVAPLFSRTLVREDIYLAGHSLGRPLDQSADDVREAANRWIWDLDEAWAHWYSDQERFRRLVARLAGAPQPEYIVPKSSATQGLRAVLNALDGTPRVLAGNAEFDSLDFVLRAYRERGRIALRFAPPTAEALIAALDEPTDLLVVSSVQYASGALVDDLRGIIDRAHAVGARVLLDVYQHAGALPLDLERLGADFAVGGSVKYTRGGPGAAWLYVRPDHARVLRTLDTGWLAKRDPFARARAEPPAYSAGGNAWLESTPAALAHAQALAGLEFTLAIGVARLRAYNLEQKARLAELLAARDIAVAGAGASHGAFVTLRHAEAERLATALRSAGVIANARDDRLRLCPDLLTSDEELREVARRLDAALRTLAPGPAQR